MSISHREFFRLLPKAVGNYQYTIQGASVDIQLEEGRLEIELSQEGRRRIASLTLPETRLEFRFSGATEDQKTAFLKRFDLAYQRGGG
jgi:hypothetical protein